MSKAHKFASSAAARKFSRDPRGSKACAVIAGPESCVSRRTARPIPASWRGNGPSATSSKRHSPRSLGGRSLKGMRQTIFDSVWLPKIAEAGNGGEASIHELEMVRKPTKPQMPHKPQKPHKPCAPFKINPKHPHKPSHKPKRPGDNPSAEECFPCPQSCVPDTVPPQCPQSCSPFPACVPGDKKKKKRK